MNAGQLGQKSVLMGMHRTAHRRRARMQAQNHSHCDIINACDRRGGWSGLSDLLTVILNPGMMARRGNILDNNQRQYNTDSGAYFDDSNVRKSQTGKEKPRFYFFLTQSAEGGKGTIQRGRITSHRHQSITRGIIRATMETRMKSRVTEEPKNTADKNRDRKGKTIAKEELPTEIFEIEDDPADADPWCASLQVLGTSRRKGISMPLRWIELGDTAEREMLRLRGTEQPRAVRGVGGRRGTQATEGSIPSRKRRPKKKQEAR